MVIDDIPEAIGLLGVDDLGIFLSYELGIVCVLI